VGPPLASHKQFPGLFRQGNAVEAISFFMSILVDIVKVMDTFDITSLWIDS
jgi:hypothetical protein